MVFIRPRAHWFLTGVLMSSGMLTFSGILNLFNCLVEYTHPFLELRTKCSICVSMYVGPIHFDVCVRVSDCCDPVLLDKIIKIIH